MKEFIGTGKTIEEATAAAKVGLNAPAEAYDNGEVKIEIVAMPKKKVLGIFGGSDAKVKASYDDEPYRKKQPKKAKRSNNDKPTAPKKHQERKTDAKKAEAAKQEVKAPAPKPEREKINAEDVDLDFLCSYVKTIVDGFKVADAEVTAQIKDSSIEVTISCDDYGIIIGRRGETLDAVQYLASLALKNKCGKYARVAINVGDYRARREETLKALAVKNANYVVRSGRRYTFEPMNPYERRIIHTAVQEVEGATSRSVGSGSDRRVVIEPEGGVRNGGRRRGYNNRSSRSHSTEAAPAASREKLVDRADVPKFGKIEVNKD